MGDMSGTDPLPVTVEYGLQGTGVVLGLLGILSGVLAFFAPLGVVVTLQSIFVGIYVMYGTLLEGGDVFFFFFFSCEPYPSALYHGDTKWVTSRRLPSCPLPLAFATAARSLLAVGMIVIELVDFLPPIWFLAPFSARRVRGAFQLFVYV